MRDKNDAEIHEGDTVELTIYDVIKTCEVKLINGELAIEVPGWSFGADTRNIMTLEFAVQNGVEVKIIGKK